MSSPVNFSLGSAAATAATGPVSHRIAPADTRAPEIQACETARGIVEDAMPAYETFDNVPNDNRIAVIADYLGVNPFSAPVQPNSAVPRAYSLLDGPRYFGRLANGAATDTNATLTGNGWIYEGEVVNNYPHGLGQFTYEDGSVLRGQFRDDAVFGVATKRWIDGTTFTGEFNNHMDPARGTMNYSDGDVFVGTFVTINDNPHPVTGTMTCGNGDVFRGNFSGDDDENSTQGTMTYASGNLRTFDGVFERDLNPIEGIAIFADGVEQCGRFRDGELHGRGTESRNGNVYDGDFANGVPHGYGTLTFADRSSYVGFFANGLRHGEGMLSHANGRVETGLFQNNVYMGNSAAATAASTSSFSGAAAGPARQTASPQSLSFSSATPAMTPVPAAAYTRPSFSTATAAAVASISGSSASSAAAAARNIAPPQTATAAATTHTTRSTFGGSTGSGAAAAAASQPAPRTAPGRTPRLLPWEISAAQRR